MGSSAAAVVRVRSASHIRCCALYRRVQEFTPSSRIALVREKEELSSPFLFHTGIIQPINCVDKTQKSFQTH